MKQFTTLILLSVFSLSMSQSMPIIPVHKSVKPVEGKSKTTPGKTKIVYIDRPVNEKKQTNEDKKRNCSQCNGTGYYTLNRSCDVCDGTGEVIKYCSGCDGEGTKKCSKCSGTGENQSTAIQLLQAFSQGVSDSQYGDHKQVEKAKCGDCSGKGFVTCSTCSGKGKVKVTCTQCYGSGIIANQVRCTLHD